MKRMQFTAKGSSQIFFAEVSDELWAKMVNGQIKRKDARYGIRTDNNHERWIWIPLHPEDFAMSDETD